MTTVLTGGAGFLGRAWLKQNLAADTIVLSRDEEKHEALRRRYPGVRTVLGDVRDATVLEPLMYGIDTVIHMAAVKFVDEAEVNVMECIDVNVRGTATVLRAAARAGVATVCVISTDKATAPLNTYGATKQLTERMVGEFAARWPNTRFVAARYGNVVGSTGSVLWKWAMAIQRGDPVTVTDPAMTRFWMAPSEAVEVVERALCSPSGTVTIPFCRSMAMGDVAVAMGAENVRTTGIRPGERMHEYLFSDEEAPRVVIDGDYALLRPAYELGRRNGVAGYTSAAPREWVDAAGLQAMVEEARALW